MPGTQFVRGTPQSVAEAGVTVTEGLQNPHPLKPKTTYTFRVCVYDGSGNASPGVVVTGETACRTC
jgi:hypothetical protein